MSDKDIRFTDKKVDESWKEQASRDKGLNSSSKPADTPKPQAALTPKPKTSKEFLNLLSSLGYQAMFHLGEIPNPETNQKEVNLQAAQEIIELLKALKDKTEGQLSPEEAQVFHAILPELQMKFAEKA